MPKLVMIMGIPGSGKTTVRNMFPTENYYIGSSDDLIPVDENGERIYNGQTLGKTWKQVWIGLGLALKEEKDVILDNTFLMKNERSAVCNIAKGMGYYTVCIWLNTCLEKCLENDKKRKHMVGTNVIADKYVRLQKPTDKEGWNLLVKLVDQDCGYIRFVDYTISITDFIDVCYDNNYQLPTQKLISEIIQKHGGRR